MDVWHILLSAGIGALIGWLTTLRSKTRPPVSTNKAIISIITGIAGGLFGAILFWIMLKLAVMKIVGVIIMSVSGTIIMLWILSKIIAKEDDIHL